MKKIFPLMISVLLLSCGQGVKKDEKVSGVSPVIMKRACSYDNEVSSLGIGIVIVPPKFTIFSDSMLTKSFVSRDMYSEDDTKTDICPKFFKPDYGIMHFVCISMTDKAYKILLNFSEFKFLPRTADYKFSTWNQYILESYGVRRLTEETGDIAVKQPLRKNPEDKSDTITIPQGHEMFCPIQVQGDWVKVKYDCFYNDEKNSHEGEFCQDFIEQCEDPVTGWIRWKQGNKLLLDIFLMP